MADGDSTAIGRTCTKCKQFKRWDDFCRAARGLNGRNSRCRECCADYAKANQDRINELSLARYYRLRAPVVRQKEKAKRDRLNSPTKLCSKCRKRKLKSEFGKDKGRLDGLRAYCRPCKAAESRKYRARNPETALKSSAEWLKRNPDAVKRKNRKYREKPENRIHQAVSSRIYAAVKGKRGLTSDVIIGYSFKELADHLERQFLPGMTWDNYGEWHIDHIIPLASFKISGPSDPELSRAWGLPNLRPLWRIDNFKKNAKRTHLI